MLVPLLSAHEGSNVPCQVTVTVTESGLTTCSPCLRVIRNCGRAWPVESCRLLRSAAPLASSAIGVAPGTALPLASAKTTEPSEYALRPGESIVSDENSLGKHCGALPTMDDVTTRIGP